MIDRLSKPITRIETYDELKDAFIKPTKLEWLYHKFIGSMPRIRDYVGYNCHWYRFQPMTEEDYRGFYTMTEDAAWNKENADAMARLYAMTNFGHYLRGWMFFLEWMFTESYRNYCDHELDDVHNYWMDVRDEMRESSGRSFIFSRSDDIDYEYGDDSSLHDIAAEWD